MKFVLNRCWGGFSLSDIACEALGCRPHTYADYDLRTNPELIAVVNDMGKWANGDCADLEVIEIPDDITDWEIDDYDGMESITYVLDGRIHHS